ncbi:MAG: SDR family oxidoreductase [bacterium]
MSRDGPVLVIGGTRGTGLLIARLLMQQGFPVRALARSQADAARRAPDLTDIVEGDITQPTTLPPAVAEARHIIFTAGRRSGHASSERQIRLVEFDGVQNTLAAATESGFDGRFLYMTASGGGRPSFWSLALNLYKGNTLEWRTRAEMAIRASGLAYTIIRAGMLTNAPGGRHGIRVTQRALPLSPFHRIPRADVASVFVAAMQHPRTARTTFDIVQQRGAEPWLGCLDRLEPDPPSPAAR